MVQAAAGDGQAFDASVSTDDTDIFRITEREAAVRAVAGCEAKVEKQRAHLAAAEQSLAEARAALAALEVGE